MTMQFFSPREYLQIDIANNFGLDKENYDVRLNWFNQHEAILESLVTKAEEPTLYWAGVNAWRDVQAGKPIGYMVRLDATASGMQLLACMTGDRNTAELCNVVPTENRADAYTIIYEEMMRKFGGEMKVARKDTKRAIMTLKI